MKRNIPAVGIEANPACVFSARVKTTWTLNFDNLLECSERVVESYPRFLQSTSAYKRDPTYKYLNETGMVERGWISPKPLKKSIAVRQAIDELPTTKPYKDALMLALMAEVVNDASNIKFGPQLYCGPQKSDVDVLTGFAGRVATMVSDLKAVSRIPRSLARILHGDARACARLINHSSPIRRFDAIISSPPYPSEHDYTRHTRLELAFLQTINGADGIRAIKQQMIRSHTKGIYKEDRDGELFRKHPLIGPIVREIEKKAEPKSHGFARLYGRVVLEYFAGMRQHLRSTYRILRSGGQCAYVLGDQASFLQVLIPTAEILATLARCEGYSVGSITKWRGRWSTATSRMVDENILFLRRE